MPGLSKSLLEHKTKARETQSNKMGKTLRWGLYSNCVRKVHSAGIPMKWIMQVRIYEYPNIRTFCRS